MVRLKDLVAFLVSEYPRPQELTRGRLEKLVYLVDTEWAWRNGEQLTQIQLVSNDFGPFVGECDATAKDLEAEGKIAMHRGTTDFGDKKLWYEWTGSKEDVAEFLSYEEKEVARKMIEDTWRLPWGKFVQFVYSTPPMENARQYERLDIVGTMAARRRAILEKVTRENLDKYREDFKALANL